MTEITATEFKARCLRLLDDVAASGDGLVITKHGRPVARLEPVAADDDLLGSVTYHVSDEELINTSIGPWDMETE